MVEPPASQLRSAASLRLVVLHAVYTQTDGSRRPHYRRCSPIRRIRSREGRRSRSWRTSSREIPLSHHAPVRNSLRSFGQVQEWSSAFPRPATRHIGGCELYGLVIGVIGALARLAERLGERLRADRTTTGRPPTNTPRTCPLRTRPSALSTSTAGRAVIRVTPAEIACLADASALGAGVRRCLQAGCASASWLDCAGVESISCTAWSTWPRRSWRSRSAAVRAAQDPRPPPPDRAPSPRDRRAGAARTSTGGRPTALCRPQRGECSQGSLRSKNSGSPTLIAASSSISACSSGGGCLRSPSRASASEVKYTAMV
jgi:hypothetical protein